MRVVMKFDRDIWMLGSEFCGFLFNKRACGWVGVGARKSIRRRWKGLLMPKSRVLDMAPRNRALVFVNLCMCSSERVDGELLFRHAGR